MGLTDGVDDDPCKFAVWTSEGSDSEIFALTAISEESKNEWITALKKLLESQTAFAIGWFGTSFFFITELVDRKILFCG